jgi:23S rRNA (cytosine1962-C5)-methyltransferase
MSASAKPSLLRLRVSAPAQRSIRMGHPWVYSDSIVESSRDGAMGDLAVVYDRNDKFLALGLYDPLSPIRLRVLHSGKPARADRDWWLQRLRAAKDKRTPHFDEARTNAWRWVNGESDGFPALVVDRYADVLVMKLYSAVWLPRLQEVLDWLRAEFPARAVVLRLSRNIQQIAQERWGVAEGCLSGETENLVIFRENGILFEAEVLKGQKTGFYLDQRDNRARVQDLARGRDMLNVFSFSGGFSLYAARGGARRVTDLDISNHALESARRNFALNDWAAEIPHDYVRGDAFDWLATGLRQTFDLIVCDPPSLARREVDREGAARAYQTLAASCLKRLNPDGVLVAASCSAHVSQEEFFSAIMKAADTCGPWRELWRSGHAVDHSATFKEAAYLKCMALAVR